MVGGLGLPQPWVGRSQVPGEKLGHHSGCLELWGFRQGSAQGKLEFTSLWPPRKRQLRVGEASGGIVGGGRGAGWWVVGTLCSGSLQLLLEDETSVWERDAWRDLTRAAEGGGGEVPSDCAGHCLGHVLWMLCQPLGLVMGTLSRDSGVEVLIFRLTVETAIMKWLEASPLTAGLCLGQKWDVEAPWTPPRQSFFPVSLRRPACRLSQSVGELGPNRSDRHLPTPPCHSSLRSG